MKTHRFATLCTTGLVLSAFSTAGCAEKQKPAEAALPSNSNAATTMGTNATPGAVAAVPGAIDAAADVSLANWTDIKDLSYDARARFFSGFKRLEAKVDVQIAELSKKRAAMAGTADTRDWDFAMKEMRDARSNLKFMGEEMSRATGPTWNPQRDKAGQAWARTQAAYDKVKSSTTG